MQTIEELREENKNLAGKAEILAQQLKESRESENELADSLQAFMFVEEGQDAAADEIKRLLGLVSTLEAQRNHYMEKCCAMRIALASRERQIKKMEAARRG